MFKVDNYTPTRVVFGPGRLKELASITLPGKKALICVTADGLMEKLGIQGRVIELLQQNGVDCVVFDEITPNPMRSTVMKTAQTAKQSGCDFLLGLGGGSSIDTAKAAAIVMKNHGDLWDYAYTGTGGKKPIQQAAPVVTVTTTCGTGTEVDPYCVVTNEITGEKLDFATDVIFPVLSIIDPELMVSLPRNLTICQGFDALFHAAECYITNDHSNRLVDTYATESVCTVGKWLLPAVTDGENLEARTHMAYAADILSGYTQALVCTTSHHILAQAIGGLFPKVPHGAALIMVARAYYAKVCGFFPQLFDELGEMIGQAKEVDKPGYSYVKGLESLICKTGADVMKLSDYGIGPEAFPQIANMTVDVVGIDCDRYTLTKEDIIEIMQKSFA